MITGRTPARTAPLLAAVALLLAGCTDEPSGTGPSATSTSADPTAAAGPLAAEVGTTPLGTTAVYRLGVSDAGEAALVLDEPGVLPPEDTRLGTGTDPRGSAEVVTGVSSGLGVGSLAVGDDGSVTALVVVDAGDTVGLHVLRVTPTGAQTVDPVAGAGVGRLVADTTDAVSDDGSTAVVATTDRTTSYPEPPDRLRVLTVDLATASVTAQAEVELGADGGLPTGVEPTGVRIGPDGAVTVLVGRATGQAGGDGAWLARFDPGLVPAGTVALSPDAELQRSRLDLTADGTAVVSMQVGSPAPLTTRLVTVAPGDDEVVPLAELASTTVDAVVTGPRGWAHLVAADVTAGVAAVRPLDLGSGELGEPVPVCPGTGTGTGDGAAPPGRTFGLARSGSGSALLAVSSCTEDDVRLAVLRPR